MRTVSLSIPASLYSKLQKLMDSSGRSEGDILREAAQRYIARMEAKECHNQTQLGQ
jgi:predicted DNA-binding protein